MTLNKNELHKALKTKRQKRNGPRSEQIAAQNAGRFALIRQF
jgi:hypothetical protein